MAVVLKNNLNHSGMTEFFQFSLHLMTTLLHTRWVTQLGRVIFDNR